MKPVTVRNQPAERTSNVHLETTTLLGKKVLDTVLRFSGWLDHYGEVSYDFQTVYASPSGRSAKRLYYRQPFLGTLAVFPMVFCEAFVPSARRLFWKPQRFPIADAHYAMGCFFLAQVLPGAILPPCRTFSRNPRSNQMRRPRGLLLGLPV